MEIWQINIEQIKLNDTDEIDQKFSPIIYISTDPNNRFRLII